MAVRRDSCRMNQGCGGNADDGACAIDASVGPAGCNRRAPDTFRADHDHAWDRFLHCHGDRRNSNQHPGHATRPRRTAGAFENGLFSDGRSGQRCSGDAFACRTRDIASRSAPAQKTPGCRIACLPGKKVNTGDPPDSSREFEGAFAGNNQFLRIISFRRTARI